jgi:hypothetical protein
VEESGVRTHRVAITAIITLIFVSYKDTVTQSILGVTEMMITQKHRNVGNLFIALINSLKDPYKILKVPMTRIFTPNVYDVVFNKREVVFYQSTKGRGRSPRPFVL